MASLTLKKIFWSFENYLDIKCHEYMENDQFMTI